MCSLTPTEEEDEDNHALCSVAADSEINTTSACSAPSYNSHRMCSMTGGDVISPPPVDISLSGSGTTLTSPQEAINQRRSEVILGVSADMRRRWCGDRSVTLGDSGQQKMFRKCPQRGVVVASPAAAAAASRSCSSSPAITRKFRGRTTPSDSTANIATIAVDSLKVNGGFVNRFKQVHYRRRSCSWVQA